MFNSACDVVVWLNENVGFSSVKIQPLTKMAVFDVDKGPFYVDKWLFYVDILVSTSGF